MNLLHIYLIALISCVFHPLIKAMEQNHAQAHVEFQQATKQSRDKARQKRKETQRNNINEFETNMSHLTQMIVNIEIKNKIDSKSDISNLKITLSKIRNNPLALDDRYATKVKALHDAVQSLVEKFSNNPNKRTTNHQVQSVILDLSTFDSNARKALNILIQAPRHHILGISSQATQRDACKAYKELALKWHPDKNHHQRILATEVFKIIRAAAATYGIH